MNEVEALIGDNRAIFEQVYHEYHPQLYYFFLRHTRSETDAEELVQLSFIKLWRGRRSLSVAYPVSQQLFRIAKSCLIDMVRQQSKESFHRDRYTHDYQHTGNTFDSITDFDLDAQLLHALEKLPPIRKKVFTMSRMQHLSYKEIADELRVSVRTVESHIYKALQQLRKAIVLFFTF